jgi:hypothetical protein
MTYIYILQLIHNKYYIGKSSNPKARIDQHFFGQGCKWTRKHFPIQIEKVIPNCDDFDEDKYTKIYMQKHGIDNVRGGSFCTDTLTKHQVKHIKTELFTADNTCFKCGEKGHFSTQCMKTSLKITRQYDSSESYDSEDEAKIYDVTCFRCGKKGHCANTCYVKYF